VSATTSVASPNPFSKSAETGKSVASTIKREWARAFQPVISSTNGTGGGSARCGQCLETKAGEKLGGADIPWIRNDEDAWAVVKRAEASRLFVLGDTHKSYLAIRSPYSTDSLSHTADFIDCAW